LPNELPSLPSQEFTDLLPLIERVIAFVVRRHHATPEEAEDFASDVKVRLLENDCAILRKFEGRSQFKTYLTTVISRLLLDYRTAAWGKWRPSEEARRRGEVAILLDRLLSRDGLSLDEAFEVMRTNHGVTLTRRDVETLAASFPVRVKRRFEDEQVLANLPSLAESPEDAVANEEHMSERERLSRALAKVMSRLDPQDRLILALHYRDGRKVTEIAQLMRLEQRSLYRRVERILKQLRQILEEEGFNGPAVLEPMR